MRRHADRLIIWKSAAQYCMSDDTMELILQRQKEGPKMVAVYLQGLLNTALVSLRTDLPNAARSYAQKFAVVRQDAETVVRQDAETQRH